MTLRVGTRGSALAMAQAGEVARAIAEATGAPADLVTVTTHGDVSRESLASLGGTGVFASALREALLRGECDLVVHSMKDLPTAAYPGLAIGCVPVRADARDALCARDGLTLAELPQGARIGTGSPRRVAQLLARRPDLEVVDIRGNVDTRLGFVASGEFDAVVLAAAGLGRLGRSDAITELFDLDDWLTAPAQGALAIEVRETDLDGATPVGEALRVAFRAIGDAAAFAAAAAERGVLAGLEAGCSAPVGAHASVDGSTLTISAAVYAPDGQASVRLSRSDALAAIPPVAADGMGDSAGADRADFTEMAVRAMINESEHAGYTLAAALLADGAATLAPRRR